MKFCPDRATSHFARPQPTSAFNIGDHAETFLACALNMESLKTLRFLPAALEHLHVSTDGLPSEPSPITQIWNQRKL